MVYYWLHTCKESCDIKQGSSSLSPTIQTLLGRRNQMMRIGQMQKAGELSLNICKLILKNKAAAMCNTNSQDMKELWCLVNTLCNTKDLTNVTDYGVSFQ